MKSASVEGRLSVVFRNFINARFNLHQDKERESITLSDIKKGEALKGANL
jgi:hypothetical protein